MTYVVKSVKILHDVYIPKVFVLFFFLIFTISGTVSTKLSDIPIYKVKSELAT